MRIPCTAEGGNCLRGFEKGRRVYFIHGDNGWKGRFEGRASE